jgi:tRNA (guanine6-N2)-methyltransferase
LLYPVTRPRALLGHENLENLLKAVDETSQLPDGTKMKGFRVSAAGSDSSVLIRLKQIISERLHLVEDSENGELLIRLRRSKASPGWEVLIRTTPKPLSVRSWRTHNTPGALNGSVAAVLVRATRPTPEDTVIDLTCGSGTLLIERAAYGPTKKLIGIDISLNALRNASEHLENAGTTKAELMQADICSPIPQEARSFSVIMANLPWGERVGTRKDNSLISQEICHRLQELAAPGARAVLLTQDHQVLRKALQTKLPYWNIKSEYKLEQRGFTPTLFILQNLEKK